MQGYSFTERVRKVLALAREVAGQLRHEYVGTEHILLGLIHEGEGVGAAVLQNLGADPARIQATLEQIIEKGKVERTGPDLPYTSRAKKVIELAMSEARAVGHSYVGTEHLLLGLVREERGIAAQVLRDAGIDLDAARAEMLRLLGKEVSGERPRTESTSTRAGVRLVTLTVQVEWADGQRFMQRFGAPADAIAFLRSLEGESRGGAEEASPGP